VSIAERMSGNSPAATAPRVAAPSSTGSSACDAITGMPVASASSWRIRRDWPAPPLMTIFRTPAPEPATVSVICRNP
jgi:hypothetical protein